MLQKLRKKLSTNLSIRGLKKKPKPTKPYKTYETETSSTQPPQQPQLTPPSSPPPPFQPPSPTMHHLTKKNKPFLFPQTHSTVLPDPSNFFSPNLLSTPLPTNSFFQNFVLKNGDQPEYIHPYLIKSSNSSLSVSYPSRFFNSSFIYQVFNPDLTISSIEKTNPLSHLSHKISSYNDLSVTLDIPSSNLRFFLVRGSPFLTFSVTQPTPLSITTIHAILAFTSNDSLTKHTFQFNNGQVWILYASSPIRLSHGVSDIVSTSFLLVHKGDK
jgi:endo-1,3(4)-beta-glucanase